MRQSIVSVAVAASFANQSEESSLPRATSERTPRVGSFLRSGGARVSPIALRREFL